MYYIICKLCIEDCFFVFTLEINLMFSPPFSINILPTTWIVSHHGRHLVFIDSFNFPNSHIEWILLCSPLWGQGSSDL